MASLLDLVDRVNKGELIDSAALEIYQESSNAAEKFLANHARAMLDLRRSHTYLLEALEAIDYADQKVLFQFLAVLGFLGLSDQRAQPVIRFGAAAINRREIALGMEAIQSGVTQDPNSDNDFTRDRASNPFVADLYNRVSQSLGWFPPGPCDWKNAQLKIGYLTSSLGDDDAAARMLLGISKHLDQKDVKLCVYSTEANVRREKLTFLQGPFTPASIKRGKETIESLNRRKASVWLAPLDLDIASATRELGQQIFKDQIDVLIMDATLSDPIASVIANWQIARAKLNLVRRTPLQAGAVDAAMYLDAALRSNDESHWRKRQIDTHFIQEGVDPVTAESAAAQRSAYGIPDHSIILATTPDAQGRFDDAFLDATVQMLRQHPQTVLLIAGEADQSQVKRRLETAGLAKRVGFAGKRKDLAEFLRLADVYLVPFPTHNVSGTLSAMSAGRAIVAMTGDRDDPQRPDDMIGQEHVASDLPEYLDRVAKLVRDPGLRSQAGDVLKARAAAQFGYEQTARSIEQLCRNLLSAEAPPQRIAA